ncbi:MAG TPA: hypothetical protein DCQ75_06555, partial [Pseudomonas sp.]|nr:hypothetical protein [Pseudomonas sp.]
MNERIEERRALQALRDHIDCLLTAGASLVGRDPGQRSRQGRTLKVRDGRLVNEKGHQDREKLAEMEGANKSTREMASG